MHKKLRKLTLNKETLRNLDDRGLRVAGGVTANGTGICAGCEPTDETCDTCMGTRCDACFSRLPQCTEAC
jgi:hypothetical protein